ncbi:MAG TPA: transporter, partial [Pirellulaceae bacterium]
MNDSAGARVASLFVRITCALIALAATTVVSAQNRGVYPLGMGGMNSGVTSRPGLTYINQLLYYSRDHARDDDGNALPVTGDNDVLMDLNTLAWTSNWSLPGGTTFSASATIPVARNSLDSDLAGNISGGGGLADSYFLPLIFGWNRDRFAVRAMYGFLAPTGRFEAGANDNVGSGYWTHTLSSGQTWYLTADKRFVLSAFEVYEFHTTQEGTGTHPGQTINLDFSVMGTFSSSPSLSIQAGIVGYVQRQTTAKTGPTIPAEGSADRYAVNAGGIALSANFPEQKASLGLRLFKEFSNRSTYQG